MRIDTRSVASRDEPLLITTNERPKGIHLPFICLRRQPTRLASVPFCRWCRLGLWKRKDEAALRNPPFGVTCLKNLQSDPRYPPLARQIAADKPKRPPFAD
jgi:hypothetical protein